MILLAGCSESPQVPEPAPGPRLTRDPGSAGPDARPPATECKGTDVSEEDDLVAVVDDAADGETFCIQPGLHDIGSETLNPKENQRFIGAAPVELGPNGEIEAEAKIEGESPDGIFAWTQEADGVEIRNLDVSGSPGDKEVDDATTKKHGRGVNGNGFEPVLKISFSRIHDNSNSGVGGIGPGTILEHVELDHNGSESYLGCCAGGVKSGNTFTIRDSYVHDNVGYGIWCDVGCEGGVWQIEGNAVTGNTVDGIRYEISMNDDGAVIRGNVVVGNNTSETIGGHGGIAIVSSWNVLVADNRLADNGNAAIEMKDDQRGGLRNIVVTENSLSDDPLKGCDEDDVVCEGNE